MEIIEKFKKQNTLIQIIDLLFIIVLIYDILTIQLHPITIVLLFLMFFIPFCQWFFKKEE